MTQKVVTEKPSFQGDVGLIRIDRDDLPAGLVPVPAENGAIIVTHSETGHHHVIEAMPKVTMYRLPEEIYEAFIVVDGDEPADLVHKRPHDTHETLTLMPGTYRVFRQREYTPEGFRRAAD